MERRQGVRCPPTLSPFPLSATLLRTGPNRVATDRGGDGMRAAVLYEANQPMVIENVTLDSPKAGEILVRIAATGICHSDYHVIDGSWHGNGYPKPVILGHE